MANPETPRSQEESTRSDQLITRRRVLGGLAGVAGLAAAPSLLAACGPSGRNVRCRPGAASQPAPGGSAPPAASLAGEVTLGSNYSDAIPKAAMQAAADSFTADTGIPVKINTVDHGTFQDQISCVSAGHAGRRLDLVLRLPHAVLRRAGPGDRHQRPVGQDRADVWRGLQGRVDRQRRQAVLHPDLPLSVGGLLPEEPVGGEGLRDPEDVRRAQDARREDPVGWPDPVRLRRQGRLAGDGHVRHPQPPAQRLRLPRRADGRRTEVDRPEGQDRLRHVQGDPALPPGRRRGPDLAGRLRDARPEEGRDVLPRDVHLAAVPGGRRRPTSRTSTSSPIRISGPSTTPRRRSTPRSTASPSARPRRTSTRRRRSSSTWPSRRHRSRGSRPTRATSRRPRTPTRAATTRSRRRPPRSSAAPSGSPSSSTATPTRTSPGRTACRPSCSTSSRIPTRTSLALQKKIQDFWDTLG